MREISPAHNKSVGEVLRLVPPEVQRLVSEIRHQKKEDIRPRPSRSLVDRSSILTQSQRASILDTVAGLVDENLFGRSEMCKQFALLLQTALTHLDIQSKSVIGEAVYYSERREVLFSWDHAWVRAGDEVIDGNVDLLHENPMVPKSVRVAPYWGPITETPPDRKLRQDQARALEPDDDVTTVWWPELRTWLDKEFSK